MLLGLFQAPGFAEIKEYRLDPAKSRVSFEVGSTFVTVHGRVKALSGNVDFVPETGDVKLPMKIEIPVQSMETGNRIRDGHMRKMLEAEKFPVIRWSAAQVHCRPGGTPQSMVCDAAGTLKIREIERQKNFSVMLTFRENHVKAEGRWSFERNEFGLKPPSMLGMARVKQEIKIEFETEWDELQEGLSS